MKEVPFEDEYVIEIEADFLTHVPLPVVIMEPNEVDLLPYEAGLKDTIVYTVTNYGLIQGDDLTLSFPTNHPTLNFEVKGGLRRGPLPAETTDIVIVKVTQKPNSSRKKRSTCGISYSASASFTVRTN